MIKRVSLENFTCHSKTELELPEGLVIFLGRNGAGKSSVIDAITYALYGEHTRGSNENVVRDGATGGQVELEFSLGGDEYEVLRRFNSKGDLDHSYLKANGKTLATGERSREGDAVTQQIRKLLGLSYNQMLSAVVIRQGELDRILSEQPKEVKGLFDEIMGLTKMEETYRNMLDVLKNFEERIRETTEHTPGDLERIEKEIESKRRELEDKSKQRERFEEEVADLENKLKEAQDKYSDAKAEKEQHDRAWALLTILKDKLDRLRTEVTTKLNTLTEYIPLLERKNAVNIRLEEIGALLMEKQEIEAGMKKIEGRLEGLRRSIQELKAPEEPAEKAIALEALEAEADKKARELKNDSMELGRRIALKQEVEALDEKVERCIEDIVGIVSKSYRAGSAQEATSIKERIADEIREREKQIESSRRELENLNGKVSELSYIDGQHVDRLMEMIKNAEREVERLGGIEKKPKLERDFERVEKILKIMEETEEQRTLPEVADLKRLEEVLGGDENFSQLIKILETLAIKQVDVSELERHVEYINELNRRLGESKASLARAKDEERKLREDIERLDGVKRELAKAREFYDILATIRDKIYHRDGPVIKSIRAWVLSNISDRAAYYLNLFDVRVSNISLEEKGRGISFECSYGGKRIDSKRLSGGEKVALALAIRLAISDVLGAKRFGFFILDEPTVHLDSENKKKLQEVFASLGRTVRQTIIITHDEEVFEDADAVIVKFERGEASNAPSEARVLQGRLPETPTLT